MIFFIAVLLSSMVVGVYILKEDKKFNNLLESVVNFDTENHKNSNNSLLNKSQLNKNNDHYEHLNDEEKKLLHISKLI